MRGSVWVYIICYLTNRQGNVFAKEKVYGFSDTRQIDTISQQKLQYNKAINKALATYRSNNNLDSDVEVGFTHLNDGITYEGRKNGVKRIKRKKTKLSGSDKRKVRAEIFRTQKEKGEQGKQITQEQKQNMYDKKVSEKEFIKLNKSNKYPKNRNVYQNKNKLKHSNTKEDKRRIYLQKTRKIEQPQGKLLKPPIVKRKNVRGYWGMNREASKELKLKSRPKDNEVWIDKSLKGRKARQVIAHETYERKLMKKGLKYKQAHKKATKYEKKIK